MVEFSRTCAFPFGVVGLEVYELVCFVLLPGPYLVTQTIRWHVATIIEMCTSPYPTQVRSIGPFFFASSSIQYLRNHAGRILASDVDARRKLPKMSRCMRAACVLRAEGRCRGQARHRQRHQHSHPHPRTPTDHET